jgi:membrane-associated phospholipid phosphatase
MALTSRRFPVDYLLAAYNVVLAVVWATLRQEAPHAAPLAAAHLAGAALPWLWGAARESRGRAAILRDLYPLILLLAFWTELDLLRDILGPRGFDAAVETLDRAVFGVNLHAVWMPSMDAVWLSETMFFSYYAYYAAIFLPPIALALQKRRRPTRDVVLRLMTVYLACYLVYIAFPVYGPHFLAVHHQGPHTQGLFYRLVDAAQRLGDSRGCAFPSSHVAGAVTIAFIGWRWFSRPVAVLLTLEALGVVLSTVYTQNHYGIDSLAGIVWALGIQIAVVPVLRRGFTRSRSPLPVPTVPKLSPGYAGGDS